LLTKNQDAINKTSPTTPKVEIDSFKNKKPNISGTMSEKEESIEVKHIGPQVRALYPLKALMQKVTAKTLEYASVSKEKLKLKI
jgi:hypothetical protein